MPTVLLDGSSLTATDLAAVARNPAGQVEISAEASDRVVKSHEMLLSLLASGRIMYGVNTGLGGFVKYLVPDQHSGQLQENLISAVATNVGTGLPDEFVRAAMVARLNCLARGVSAISPENFGKYRAMFNAGVIPVIPEKGSLGASGDLGPLAFIALVATGRWRAKYGGVVMPGGQALAGAGISPMKLAHRDGLALINGTSTMAGMGAVLAVETAHLLDIYDVISSLTLETLGAKIDPLRPRVHGFKPHAGQLAASERIFSILSGSAMIDSEEAAQARIGEASRGAIRQGESDIEDAYSLRCTPQMLGPLKDTLAVITATVERELNSVNDNPLFVSEENNVFHTGHFHGQYVAMAMDQLSLCLTTLTNLCDRRIDRLLSAGKSNGLPAFLCREDAGLRLGLMGAQFLSTSLTAENRSLCVPVSIQTLPSTGDFQDIVSMGLVAARRAWQIFNNAVYAIAVELLCACQAADIRGAELLSPITGRLYEVTRQIVPYLDEDTVLTDYLEALVAVIKDESVMALIDLPAGA